MMSESKEMVVIITGASRGIGLATAHHLLSTSPSTKLLVIARTRASLEELQQQYSSSRVEVLAGDISDPSVAPKAVDLAMSRWGRLDALIVNHGSLDPVKKVAESGVGEWRNAFDANVFSAVGLVQAALPSLRASHGRIVLTSSGASISAYQGWGAYGAGKAVLNHLALTLSVEEPDVITVSIRPGTVDTEMQREIREVHHERMSEGDKKKFSELKQAGRLLRPEQPGHVIAELAVRGGKEFSGKFLSWNDELLKDFQEAAPWVG
ncbi:short chain dehydrogenase-like protein [Plenodomus tracheiphilus IPT5]|uniref:Short chain dehydrogenase-like protein n=1 Tax=Plenodomus tracheiphilus IPT5 TaxID=1408161 RepID=A0A6A7BF66_9PLEO|nr:short chain dehydrogenase-like protein [Plenodomus tracheiphilus IPT5]